MRLHYTLRHPGLILACCGAFLMQGCSGGSGSGTSDSAIPTPQSAESAPTSAAATAPSTGAGVTGASQSTGAPGSAVSTKTTTASAASAAPGTSKSSSTADAPVLTIDTGSYTLVSSTRVGRTGYSYSYTVNITNSGTAAASSVSATVSSNAAATMVVNGTVSFGNVAAGQTVTSTGTFTIQQNRTVAFNPAALSWSVSTSTGTVLAALQALVMSGKLPTLDVTNSLLGTDSNGNGVRDDIDALIAGTTDSTAQKAALTQFARSLQGSLAVDTTNASALSQAALTVNKAVSCLFQQYNANTAVGRVHWLQELTVNTLVRLTAYETFNSALNGTVMANPPGEVCGG
jgi:hypothetical protein